MQVAAGIVGGPPLPPGTTPFQYTVNAQGRLIDPKQFGDIIVKTGADGSVTRVKDVARVELGAADYTHQHALQRPARRWASPFSSCPAPTPSPPPTPSTRRWRS